MTTTTTTAVGNERIDWKMQQIGDTKDPVDIWHESILHLFVQFFWQSIHSFGDIVNGNKHEENAKLQISEYFINWIFNDLRMTLKEHAHATCAILVEANYNQIRVPLSKSIAIDFNGFRSHFGQKLTRGKITNGK